MLEMRLGIWAETSGVNVIQIEITRLINVLTVVLWPQFPCALRAMLSQNVDRGGKRPVCFL